jgi:hypothetical protein
MFKKYYIILHCSKMCLLYICINNIYIYIILRKIDIAMMTFSFFNSKKSLISYRSWGRFIKLRLKYSSGVLCTCNSQRKPVHKYCYVHGGADLIVVLEIYTNDDCSQTARHGDG